MSEETSEPKRITPLNLGIAVAAILLVQFLALLITTQNGPTYLRIVNASGYNDNFFGTTPGGSVGNALVLVAVAFALTIILVRLLKRKMVMSFRVLIFGSLSLSSFVLTLLTADVFALRYAPSLEIPIAFGVPLAIVAAIGYTVFVRNNVWLSTTVLAFVGAEVGSFLAHALPPQTVLALPVVFSIYDIYAVFRGPLKQLIGTAPGIALVGMSIRAGGFTLGLGDVVFYTMLPSVAYFTLGLQAAIGVVIAIDCGVAVTLFLLSKKRFLPGLPIPMSLGLAVILGAMI